MGDVLEKEWRRRRKKVEELTEADEDEEGWKDVNETLEEVECGSEEVNKNIRRFIGSKEHDADDNNQKAGVKWTRNQRKIVNK